MPTRRELLAGLAAIAILPHKKGEAKIMEQRISLITLGVRDLAVSKKFYVDGLGWKPGFEDKDIVFFQVGGSVFSIFRREDLAADFQADAASFGQAAFALAYNTRAKSEVEPLIEKAVSAGAKLLKAPREAVWGGYSGYFADPDGFAWEVAWNPHWRIAPDGSVSMQS
jgi:uncharacterized protein